MRSGRAVESDADTWYGAKAIEARQLAWLTAQFYEALVALEVPEDLVHGLVMAWFEEELAESEVEATDDDD